MKRNATALRAFTHADDSFAKGQVILGMEPSQFTDWSAEGVDLVREATDAEVARAKGETTPKATTAPARRKSRTTATKAAAAKTPADPAAAALSAPSEAPATA